MALDWQREAPGIINPSMNLRTGRVTCQEVWFATNVPWGVGYDGSWSAIEATLPRTLGVPHPDQAMSSAVCVNISRRYGPTGPVSGQPGTVKVLVEFDSYVRFGSGRSSSTTRVIPAGTTTVKMPFCTKIISGVNGGRDIYNIADIAACADMYRPRMRRIAGRVVTGNADDLTYQIMQQIGAGYFFRANPYVADSEGIPYVLASFGVESIPTGGNWVEYTFETQGPVPVVPAGTFFGQDVELPALNYLEQWGPPDMTRLPVPIIPVVFPNIRPGAPLP